MKLQSSLEDRHRLRRAGASGAGLGGLWAATQVVVWPGGFGKGGGVVWGFDAGGVVVWGLQLGWLGHG